jgi:hypothetical protein
MVDDRVTDGARIAELLASELTGMATGALDRVAVTDADPSATPSASGTRAYRVTLADEAIGAVTIYPASATLVVDRDLAGKASTPDLSAVNGVTIDRDAGSVQVSIARGAAVKDVADWVGTLRD